MGSLCSKDGQSLDQPPSSLNMSISKGRTLGRRDFIGVITDHKITEDFEVLKDLGEGSFAQVKLAKNKKTGVQEVVKRIAVDPTDMELNGMIKNEIEILMKCVRDRVVVNCILQDHPNIIGIRSAYKEPRVIYIVEEYIPNCQPMTKLFQKDGSIYNEQLRVIVVEQLLRALNYMHLNSLVHRDLKSDNVVYSGNSDSNNLELKLIDFGFSQVSQDGQKKLNDFVGTPFYIAPEIINQKPYGSKCDIWSLGVLVYQIMSGEMPFNGKSRSQLFKSITTGNYHFRQPIWENVSKEAKSFIRSCLNPDQNERPSAKDLLEHEWLKSNPSNIDLSHHRTDFCKQMSINFRAIEKTKSLQWSIISYMNSLNLYQESMTEIRREFESLDANKDGRLSLEEIQAVLVATLTSEQCEAVLQILKDLIDSNQNGYIDYSEFINLTIEHQKLCSVENLKKAFRKLDLDNNGNLSIDEIKKAFEAGGGNKRTEKFWREIIKSMDTNMDGIIQLEEFVNYMEQLRTDEVEVEEEELSTKSD